MCLIVKGKHIPDTPESKVENRISCVKGGKGITLSGRMREPRLGTLLRPAWLYSSLLEASPAMDTGRCFFFLMLTSALGSIRCCQQVTQDQQNAALWHYFKGFTIERSYSCNGDKHRDTEMGNDLQIHPSILMKFWLK